MHLNTTASRVVIALAVCFATTVVSRADVLVTVKAPFSNPPFAVSGGATVSYSPSNGIDLFNPSGFPQPNTDVENDNMFGVSLNYGGTGYTAMVSRYVNENAPQIALTVGSLVDGQAYEAFVQSFVNSGSDLYGGRYGFVSGNLSTFANSSGGTLIAQGINGPSGQGQFQVREFDLGIQHSTGGQLTFYFDDFDAADRVGDFVALRLAPVPEPSTWVLAAVGVAVLLSRAIVRRLRLRS